jgi:hypothetical protein
MKKICIILGILISCTIYAQENKIKVSSFNIRN